MTLDFAPLPTFLAACVVVVLTPGVDAFLLLRTSMRSGTRSGLLALAGIHAASALHLVLVISGLGALVAGSPAALTTLRWLGAGYLVYLAVTILVGMWRARHELPTITEPAKVSHSTLSARGGNPFTQELFSSLTNPKTLLFSLAFLPQFIGSSGTPVLQLTMLGVIFLAVAAIWEIAIVLAASRIAERLRRPRVMHTLDGISAAAFLTISVGLLV